MARDHASAPAIHYAPRLRSLVKNESGKYEITAHDQVLICRLRGATRAFTRDYTLLLPVHWLAATATHFAADTDPAGQKATQSKSIGVTASIEDNRVSISDDGWESELVSVEAIHS